VLCYWLTRCIYTLLQHHETWILPIVFLYGIRRILRIKRNLLLALTLTELYKRSSSQAYNIIHSWCEYSYYWLILFFEEVSTYVHLVRVRKLNFSEITSKFHTVIPFVTADFRKIRDAGIVTFIISVPNDTCLAPVVHYLPQ